jgi:hypothetical protein
LFTSLSGEVLGFLTVCTHQNTTTTVVLYFLPDRSRYIGMEEFDVLVVGNDRVGKANRVTSPYVGLSFVDCTADGQTIPSSIIIPA